jgi:phosphoribosyl-ATP pyrophosphohydrolase
MILCICLIFSAKIVFFYFVLAAKLNLSWARVAKVLEARWQRASCV